MNVHDNKYVKKILQQNPKEAHGYINSLNYETMNDLEKFFFLKPHRPIYKVVNFFELYDRYFSKFRGKEVTVVEIGVYQGGSLQMWKDYFGPKARIIGVDITPGCKAFEEDQIEIMIGSQDDPNFLEKLKREVSKIDILIDDGGHRMNQQITTFEYLYPHISENGVYWCEDIATSYWETFGGGYKNPNSYIEYTKNLIDSLNAWYSKTPDLSVSDFTKSSYSIAYYNSIVVIEKRESDKAQAINSMTN